jgi:hypothetical protein
MRQPAADALLVCWERGRDRHPLDRALLLYSIAAPECDPDTLADRSLGQRNAALLRLHQSMFGDALGCCIDCPRCGERLEFALRASTLLARPRDDATHIELDGLRFRLPTTRDLARIARESEEDVGAQKLLLSLIESDQAIDASTTEVLADRLTRAVEDADPCLDFALDFDCPACAHAWTASFDIAAHLWEEIDARSRRLLDEVHVLARPYGWLEREILDLTNARRMAYLERAMA